MSLLLPAYLNLELPEALHTSRLVPSTSSPGPFPLESPHSLTQHPSRTICVFSLSLPSPGFKNPTCHTSRTFQPLQKATSVCGPCVVFPKFTSQDTADDLTLDAQVPLEEHKQYEKLKHVPSENTSCIGVVASDNNSEKTSRTQSLEGQLQTCSKVLTKVVRQKKKRITNRYQRSLSADGTILGRRDSTKKKKSRHGPDFEQSLRSQN